MMNYNDYDFTKKMLKNIRNIQEGSVKKGNSRMLNENVTNPDTFSDKDGQKVNLNDMPGTGAFLRNRTNADLKNDQKNNVVTTVSQFLKTSGLILDIVDIQVFNGRVVMTSSNIKNPGVDFIKSIVIDTDLDDPKISFIDQNADINPWLNFSMKDQVEITTETATKTYSIAGWDYSLGKLFELELGYTDNYMVQDIADVPSIAMQGLETNQDVAKMDRACQIVTIDTGSKMVYVFYLDDGTYEWVRYG